MTETGVEKRGCPFWMKLVLLVSLMLNVAVVGFVATNRMKDDRQAESDDQQIRWILRLVPEDRRDFTKAHFGEVRGQLRSIRDTRRAQLDQIVGALRSEPFAPLQLEEVLATRRADSEAVRSIVHERLVVLLNEFTPAERAEFANGLEEQITRWRERTGN